MASNSHPTIIEKRELALQKKKHEEIKLPQDFEMLREPQERIFFKKLCVLTRDTIEVKDCCYIPEQNTLIVIIKGNDMIRIYNATSFKAVESKKCEKRINMARYFSYFERVFLGGQDFYLEVYNPKTRQTELKSKLNRNSHIEEIIELKERNALAVGTKNRNIHILSRDLVPLYKINVSAFCDEPIQDIIDLHDDFLLVTRQFFNKKRISLCNLTTRKVTDFADIEVALSSCIEVSKQDSTKIIICLANIPGKTQSRTGRFRLVQLVQEANVEDLVLYRTSSKNHEFSDFKKIKDSEYFAAKFYEGSSAKIALIKINGDRIQPLKSFQGSDCSLIQIQMCMVMKKSSLMIGTDKSGKICVYDCKKTAK